MNLAKSNVVLLVAAAVLAIPTWLQLRREAEVFTDLGRVPLLFDGLTTDNVTNVLLAKPKAEQPPPDPSKPDQKPPVAYDQLLLQKSDKGFVFGAPSGERAGVPALKERVERDVFGHLRAIRAEREVMVQTNATPQQLADFGLDEEHAFLVRLSDATNRVVADLLVGKDAGQGQSGTEAVRGVFVRKSDSNDVILYEPEQGNWRRDIDENGWIDRTLARIEPDKVRRIALRNAATAGTVFTFAREPGKSEWLAVEPPPGLGAVRQGEVETLVQRCRYLSVQDFRGPLQRAGNLAPIGLQPPAIEVELVLQQEDGEKLLKLAVGNKLDDKNEYYLTCSESPFLLTWPASTVTAFEVDVKAQWFDPVGPPVPTPTDGNGAQQPPK